MKGSPVAHGRLRIVAHGRLRIVAHGRLRIVAHGRLRIDAQPVVSNALVDVQIGHIGRPNHTQRIDARTVVTS